MKNKQIKQVGLFIQIILIVFLAYFLIMSIFLQEFITVLEAVCGLTLLCMAYNSNNQQKRKGMSIVYLFVGIFCLISSLFL